MSNTTPNTLSPELKAQIENESVAITAKFKHNNDYQVGYRQGFEDGYDSGGCRYALKLQQAEEMMERMAREIQNAWDSRSNGCITHGYTIRLINVVTEYNNYKQQK